MRTDTSMRVRNLLIVSALSIIAVTVLLIFQFIPPSRRNVTFPFIVTNGVVFAGLPFLYLLWLGSAWSRPYAFPVRILIGGVLVVYETRSILLLLVEVAGVLSPRMLYRTMLYNVLLSIGLLAAVLAYGTYAKISHRSDATNRSKNMAMSIVDEANRTLLTVTHLHRGTPEEALISSASDRLVRLKQLLSAGNPDANEAGFTVTEDEKFQEIQNLSQTLGGRGPADSVVIVERVAVIAEELYRSVRTSQQLAGRR